MIGDGKSHETRETMPSRRGHIPFTYGSAPIGRWSPRRRVALPTRPRICPGQRLLRDRECRSLRHYMSMFIGIHYGMGALPWVRIYTESYVTQARLRSHCGRESFRGLLAFEPVGGMFR